MSSCPVWDGRGGHPLLITGEDINSVYLSNADVALSSLFQREKIHVEFPWLHLNIDTEDDLSDLYLASKEDWF